MAASEGVPSTAGALPLSDTNALLRSAAQADKQQALVAHIFPIPASTSATHQQQPTDTLAQLSTLRNKLEAYLQKHANSSDSIGGRYIWHREPPSLSLSLPASTSHSTFSPSSPPSVRLHLRTGGDCVEDEWFIVYLLHLASRDTATFGIPLAITLEDEDGQFILIEAADVLPKWVTPDNVANRVWIYQGRLHLVPLEHRSPNLPAARVDHHADEQDDEATITIGDAIRAVSDASTFTSVSEEVEQAAFARIRDYPLAAADHHHTTLVYLSRRVARVLQHRPQLVSSATEALTTRDVVSSRAAMKLKRFPFAGPDGTVAMEQDDGEHAKPGLDDNEIVLTPVRLTRHLYAHLCYDRFFPPKAFGKDWQTAVEKYRLRMHQNANGAANATNAMVEDEDAIQKELREGRWRDLGAKIWCGLEMAYEDSVSRRSKQRRRTRQQAHGADSTLLGKSTAPSPANGQDYTSFVASLKRLGYFGDEIEGSARYKVLEEEAAAQLSKLTGKTMASSVADTQEADEVSDRIDALLSAPSGQGETGPLTVVSPAAPSASLASYEDSEDWMVVNTSDLDAMLDSRFSSTSQPQPASSRATQSTEEDKALHKLQQFASKMDQFMKTQSDERGAAFLDELDDDEKLDWDDDELMFEGHDDGSESETDGEDEEVKVQREVEKRMKQMDEGERTERLQRIVPGLEGGWGSSATDGTTTAAFATPSQPANVDRDEEMQTDLQSSAPSRSGSLAETLDRLSSTHTLHVPQSTSTAVSCTSTSNRGVESRIASQEMRATSTLLSRGQKHYDGMSDSDSDELEQETSPQVRRELAREYEVQDDDAWLRSPEGEEEGDVVEEEGEEGFLEFVRTSLGLSMEQYEAIMEKRRKEGRYVPAASGTGGAAGNKARKATKPSDSPKPASVPSASASATASLSSSELRPNPSITTFDTAMDELDRHIASHSQARPDDSPSAAAPSVEEEQDLSLLSHLLSSPNSNPDDLPRTLLQHLPPDLLRQLDTHTGTGVEGDRENMLRQFLQAQGEGAIGLLAARLGVGKFPLAKQDE